jgi:predicted deacylase
MLGKHVLLMLIVVGAFHLQKVYSMPRKTQSIIVPSNSIGTKHNLLVHHFVPVSSEVKPTKKVYIQASLHADELPGLLVAHHLLRLLEAADSNGQILQEIIIVPYANPIGLSQQLLGSHIGRFSLETGINFNREYIDYEAAVAKVIEGKLSNDPVENVRIIREAILAEVGKGFLGAKGVSNEETMMKKILFKLACPCDIVLDLHCDSDAVLHLYTNDRLWPDLSDLAQELHSQCNLLAPATGFDSFDEACSCPWAGLADRFPSFPIPMACESATVELRGESDVYDELALPDAQAIFRFLQRRCYIKGDERTASRDSLPPLLREASPLSGVDMIEATKVGVMAWKVRAGDVVQKNQILGEIVDIEDAFAPRTEVISKTSGIIFSMSRHKLVRPGEVIIKVAGVEPLEWRVGNLLTS